VDILSARMTERYIAHMDFLIASEETRSPSDRRYGFTVLAIGCMSVETLGAFIEDLEDADEKRRVSTTLRHVLAKFSEFLM
jgi:hypothetical protein